MKLKLLKPTDASSSRPQKAAMSTVLSEGAHQVCTHGNTAFKGRDCSAAYCAQQV